MPFRYFEDFRLGDRIPLAAYTVSRDEVLEFAAEYDPQPMHLDDSAGEASLLAGLGASGWHTCAMFMRMMCDGFLLASSSLGSPGIDKLSWLAPVRPGDRLSGTSTVLDARASKSRPDMGIVRFLHEVVNQDGVTVMRGENPIMFATRTGGGRP
ncbi:MAG: MaoC family dehydratase [Hyphomicrobiaceae bacterium]|nr:MaoC family dehydratase [Hyphomicrobiaceae bacterium]